MSDLDALAAKFGGKDSTDYDALASRFQAKQTPLASEGWAASEMSPGAQYLAGAGKWFTDRVRGAGERSGLITPEEVAQIRAQDAPLVRPAEVIPPIEGGKLGVHKDVARPGRDISSPGGMGNASAGIATGAALTALFPWLNTVAGGAALGAGLGVTEPTAPGESVLTNVATNAALGVGANVVSNLAPRATAAVVQPFFKSGQQRLAGEVLDQYGVPANMPAATGSTPGWQPTLAEAVGKPSVSILQRGLASLDGREGSVGDMVTQRGLDNNAAAINAIRKLAGTPEQQSMDKAVREYMSGPLYKQAEEDGIDQGMASAMKPQIKNLMDRPSMKMAAGIAKQIFGEESVALARTGDVRGLQMMRQALDDIIEKSKVPGAIGRNQLAALNQTRADLISTMQDLAPKLREADTQYATFSRPINESAVASELEKKLVPAIQMGKPDPSQLNASQYAKTLNDLDKKIPSLTGFAGSTVKNTMSPGGMKTLQGIFDDLQKRENLKLGMAQGSNTAQNISTQGIIKRTLGPLGFPEGVAQSIAQSAIGRSLGRVADVIYKIPDREIQAELAKAVLDPQYAAQLVSKANTPLLKGKAKMAGQLLQLMAAPTTLGLSNAKQ